MRKRILATFVTVLLLFPSSKGAIHAPDKTAEPNKFFREYIGLSDDQIEQVHSGKAIAKILETRTPDEVFVFGSVYIKALLSGETRARSVQVLSSQCDRCVLD